MNVNNLIKFYNIGIGAIIIISWILILFNETLPESANELIFHICSECIMALFCIVGGIFIHNGKLYGFFLSLIGLAMLIYSTLNAIGYYLNEGKITIVIFFAIIFTSTITVILLIFKIIKS